MSEFEKPSIAVDVIVCSVVDHKLCVLVVKRNREPFIHRWGLIGGFMQVCPRNKDGSYVRYTGSGLPVAPDETIADTADRIIKRDLGITGVEITSFRQYDNPLRDTRNRTVSMCNYAILSVDDLKLIDIGDSISEYKWVPIHDVKNMKLFAFDHKRMIGDFAKYMTRYILLSDIMFDLCGYSTSISQLRRVVESVTGREHANFERFLKNRFVLEDTGTLAESSGGRPSKIYRYVGLLE